MDSSANSKRDVGLVSFLGFRGLLHQVLGDRGRLRSRAQANTQYCAHRSWVERCRDGDSTNRTGTARNGARAHRSRGESVSSGPISTRQGALIVLTFRVRADPAAPRSVAALHTPALDAFARSPGERRHPMMSAAAQLGQSD